MTIKMQSSGQVTAQEYTGTEKAKDDLAESHIGQQYVDESNLDRDDNNEYLETDMQEAEEEPDAEDINLDPQKIS